MEGHAKKCVERYRELAIRTLQSINSMHWWPSFQRKRIKIRGRLAKSMLSDCSEILVLGAYWKIWYSMVNEQIYTKWTKACDKRLNRLISYIHHTCEYKQYCFVGDTAKQCRLGLFQDSDFMEILTIQNLLLEEHCAFLEVTYLFRWVACVRNKLQFRIFQQFPKSLLWTGLRLDGVPALDLWDLIVSVFGTQFRLLRERGDPWSLTSIEDLKGRATDDFFEYIYHVGCAINLHSIINSGLTPGGQNLSKRQTVFLLFVNPMHKEHKGPETVDLKAARLAQYMQTAWKKHQNTVYWVDIRLAQMKGLKFYQTRWNAIILYKTLPAYCIPKAIKMETGEIIYEKVYESPRPPPKISFKHNWMKEMCSEVVGEAESSQPKTPKPIHRTGRLVTTEQTSRSSSEEIDTRFLLGC